MGAAAPAGLDGRQQPGDARHGAGGPLRSPWGEREALSPARPPRPHARRPGTSPGMGCCFSVLEVAPTTPGHRAARASASRPRPRPGPLSSPTRTWVQGTRVEVQSQLAPTPSQPRTDPSPRKTRPPLRSGGSPQGPRVSGVRTVGSGTPSSPVCPHRRQRMVPARWGRGRREADGGRPPAGSPQTVATVSRPPQPAGVSPLGSRACSVHPGPRAAPQPVFRGPGQRSLPLVPQQEPLSLALPLALAPPWPCSRPETPLPPPARPGPGLQGQGLSPGRRSFSRQRLGAHWQRGPSTLRPQSSCRPVQDLAG